MPTKNAVKFSPDSKERGLTLVESVTLKFPEDWLPEKKKGQDVETGPVITVNAVEDSLDGGLVAWSIVLGVGKFVVTLPSHLPDELVRTPSLPV